MVVGDLNLTKPDITFTNNNPNATFVKDNYQQGEENQGTAFPLITLH